MKPICKPCQRFFRAKKNGYSFIEAMPKPGIPAARCEPGTAEPDQWTPYKLWIGDLWACEGCGAEIVTGVGSGPITEHYKDDFQRQLDLYDPKLQVNDC